MTIKELYTTLKEYEKVMAEYHDVDSRIATEDNIPDTYYRFRDLMLKNLEDIGNMEV